MALDFLSDFFTAHHNCRNWDIQRAVMRCATGRYRASLRKAAHDWKPNSHFHHTLKRMMVTDDPPPLAGRGIARIKRNTQAGTTPAVTRVCRELEAWLREHYQLPEPPAQPPLQVNTIWDIFNATDRYSEEDIKGGVWHTMYGTYGNNDAWKPAIQWHVRWRTPNSAWERELTKYILTEAPPRPENRTTTMYNLARRIKAFLNKNSTHCPVPTLEKIG